MQISDRGISLLKVSILLLHFPKMGVLASNFAFLYESIATRRRFSNNFPTAQIANCPSPSPCCDRQTAGRPAGLGDDHFGAEFVELVPEVLGLESTMNAGQQRTVVSRGGEWGSSTQTGIQLNTTRRPTVTCGRHGRTIRRHGQPLTLLSTAAAHRTEWWRSVWSQWNRRQIVIPRPISCNQQFRHNMKPSFAEIFL